MVFKFISTAQIVDGHIRSCIYDLERSTYYYIPKALSEIILEYSGKIEWEILYKLFPDQKPILKEYYDFLVNHDLIFFTDCPSCFPELTLNYDYPGVISNCIIELNSNIIDEKKTRVLDTLNISAFEIIVEYKSQFKELCDLMPLIETTRCRSICISIINGMFDQHELELLTKNSNKLTHIFYSHDIEELGSNLLNGVSLIRKKTLINQDSYTPRFVVNLSFYIEAINYNPFFNKKLYIDKKGRVSNFPQSNIKEQFPLSKRQFINLIENDVFGKFWSLNKDFIENCKHCEHRYMCFDNRIPVKNLNNNWEYSSSCNYNPYLAKWKGQEGYVSVEYWKRLKK